VAKVTVEGPRDDARVCAWLRESVRPFLPRAVIVMREAASPAVHVCRDGACRPPVFDVDAVRAALEDI
jgi:hypothetical protein